MKQKIIQLVRGILKRNARAHASSTAFFFFMSMIPLLIILASIVPLFNISINDILNFFREIVPVGAVSLVESVLREAFDHSGLAFSASALILLWTASRGVSALIGGLNAMYDRQEDRKFAKLTLLTFGYTIALMAFLIIEIYLIFSGGLRSWLKTFFPQIRLQTATTTFAEFLILLMTAMLFFCLAYKALPSGKQRLARQFPGAFIASSGWVLFSLGFRIYVSVFNSFTRLYGSLATVIILLFWFYWIFFILLAGGYVNAHLGELVPEKFLTLFYEKKNLSLVVSGLFLVGFVSFLCDCYLNWSLYQYSSIRPLLILFRILTLFCWVMATVTAARQMQLPFPKLYQMLILVFVVADVMFLQRKLFPASWVFLILFAIWNLVILLLCGKVLFQEDSALQSYR